MNPFELTRTGLANPASLAKIELVPCTDLDTYPGQANGQLLGAITLKAGKAWSVLGGMGDQTRGYEETARRSDHGRSYAFKIVAFYPGDSAALRAALGGTEWTLFVARVTDALGVARVIGNSHFGLTLDYDSMVDADMGGQRGTAFTLMEELPVPSALVV